VPSTFRFNIVDVFTDTPLTGNQLAVFTDARELPEHMLQPLAKEIGFSETVFVYPGSDEAHARLRIFTPGIEVEFAGHPTLGAAFVLAAPMQLELIRLETRRGVIPVRLEREGARIVFGRMEQPIPSVAPFDREAELLAALGVARSELPVEVYDNGLHHVYVTLGSEEEVASLRPDFSRLEDVGEELGVNTIAGSGSRWKTRMFTPVGSVAEDPATGSAAGPLALHLARHGRIVFGDEIEITQGVEIGRPSKLYARVDGNVESVERVEVGGSAVVVARGEFRL
jgi:trans-2,3-dihydro-3-hydroxyanthranilate isomerase